MNRRTFIQSGLILGMGAFASYAHAGLEENLSGDITHVHDPVLIKHDDLYYLFSTGINLPVRTSPDLINWQYMKPLPGTILRRNPNWVREAIPGVSNLWAPDIAYFNDKYHLYYSASTFGSNRSLIGLFTNTTLNPEDDDYEWVDEGVVVESTRESNYNAIDPNLIIDEDGEAWLSFGSFWSGIKMIRIDYETGKPPEGNNRLYALASRRVNSGAVEAPFIIYHDGFYYLFVSFDFCCRGADSTYHVMVGRSESITGPYVDRDNTLMLSGGGTQVTFSGIRWKGPGHNAILQENGETRIVYHAYDAANGGVPTLRIDPLEWDDDGWPFIPV